jgi:uncharacterized protein
MIALISPAKSMDTPEVNPKLTYSQPLFSEEIQQIVAVLRKVKPAKMSQLMSISEKLALLNVDRYNSFKNSFSLDNGSYPAITSFTGDVYLGLDAKSLTESELKKVNDQIIILSGLYGKLKPLDLIQPYRLEMSTSIAIGKHKNLYQFWNNKVCQAIEDQMSKSNSTHIINLASDEYYKVVKPHVDDKKVIHINFMEEKNGKWSFISFNAKKARGLMCRYMIKSKAKNPQKLKEFDYEDYCFNESLSAGNQWIFTRKFVPISEKRAAAIS